MEKPVVARIPTAGAIVLVLVLVLMLTPAANTLERGQLPSTRAAAVSVLLLIITIAAHLPSLRWLEVLLSDDRPVAERIAVKLPLASQAQPARPRARQPRRRLVAAK